MQFTQARWFREGRQGKAIRLFVIHDAETPEKATSAESVANYFKNVERHASAHYVTDSNSSVQCVRDEDTAFGAAGANNDGLHFEQAGYAKQTEAEWLDAYGLAQMAQLGELLRAKSTQHGVPLRWLTRAEVADGHTKGLCTHADVTAAFPKVSTGHTDPGPHFPKDRALAIWQGHEEDDMDSTQWKELVGDRIDGALIPVSRSSNAALARMETFLYDPATGIGKLLGDLIELNEDQVDEAALGEIIAKHLNTLGDSDIARIARAAADEHDRRERARLGTG